MSILLKFLTFLCCLATLQSFAQPVIPRFETLSVNEGLSQGSVYAITQDKFGFIWLGTADGLNRYDGNEIKIYKTQSAKLDVESSYIRGQLAEDDDGNIWFGNEAGIYYYQHNSDKIINVFSFDKNVYKGTAFHGVHIKNGKFWMLNNSSGIFSFNLKTHKLQQYNHEVFSKKEAHIYNKSNCDRQGNIWFSICHNDGLYCFNTTTQKFVHHFKGQDCLSITFGNKKHFIIGEKTISCYDSVTQKSTTLFFHSYKFGDAAASFVFEDNFKRIWAGFSGKGIACFDAGNGLQYLYQHDNRKQNSLPINSICCHYVDAGNNLWIGTDGAGVARIDLKPPMFNLFPLDAGDYPNLKDYFTKSFYEDKGGKIWAGTHNNGFNIIDPATRQVEHFDHYGNKKLNAVGAIFHDRDSVIWIGHAMGFLQFNKIKNKFTELKILPKVPLSISNIYANDIKQIFNGSVIAATQSGVVLFTKTNGVFQGKSHHLINNLGSQATSIVQTKDSFIWVATTYAGLLKVKQNDTLFVSDHYFAGINIRSVHADEIAPDIL